MKKRLLAAALAILFILPGCTGEKSTADPSKSAEPAEPSQTAPADRELLLSFLNGEIKATVYKDIYHFLIYAADETLMGAESLSFPELRQLMGTDSDADAPSWEISYAMMETMGGKEMLVVRFQGQPDYDGGNYFILGVYEHEVRLTHAEPFWSRNRVQLCQNLIFTGNGSAGAGDSFTWCGYMDDEGDYRLVYMVESLSGQWVAMYASSVFGMDIDWAMDCECILLSTETEKFYELNAGQNTDPEKLALLREYLDQQGGTEIDSVEAAVAQAKEAHGVTDTPLFDDWTLWQPAE